MTARLALALLTAIAPGAAIAPSARAAILPASGGTAQLGADIPITGGFGSVGTAVGDVNADGYADVFIPGATPRVLLGTQSTSAVDIGQPSARTWTITHAWKAAHGDGLTGVRVFAVGDVNRDGRDDVLVAPSQPDLSDPATPVGVVLSGPAAGGTTTSTAGPAGVLARLQIPGGGDRVLLGAIGAGDVDGDGADDLALQWRGAAAGSGSRGSVSIVYGGPTLSGAIDLADPRAVGTHISATEPTSVPAGGGDPSDYSLLRRPTAVGDVNGDGKDDLVFVRQIVGGKSYLWYVFGSAGRAHVNLDAADPRVARVGPVDFGAPVSAMGDANGDGFDDVLVSLSTTQSVVLRGQSGFRTMGVSSTFPRLNGVLSPAAPPVDVNGDGLDDLVGSWFNSATGQSLPGLVLFGSKGGSITVPQNGAPFVAGIRFADSVAAAGDVNGDGKDDVLNTAGVVLGYGAGTAPTPDSTPPAFAPTVRSGYGVGPCGFFGQRRVIEAELSARISESARVDLAAVQNGFTRRGSIGVTASANAYVRLPRSLIAATTGTVAVTMTPVDLAGNTGATTTLTVPITGAGWSLSC